MTGKYYTIQISYSTQNPMGKISISLKTRVRLPGHPQTFFNELPARESRKGQVDPAICAIASTAKQKKERQKTVWQFVKVLREKNSNNEFEKLVYNNSKP